MSAESPATRILYVEGNDDGTIGGSYFSMLFLVSGLDRARFEPIVLFTRENNLMPRFRERGIRTIVRPRPTPTTLEGRLGRLLSKGVNFYNGVVAEPLRLARLLRCERIALVHLNNSVRRNHPWIIGALFAGIPCITHERGINDQFQRRDRILARSLRAVICISKAVEENFRLHNLGHLRLVTIYNGLDPAEMRVTRMSNEIRQELGIQPTARLIGIVGNIRPWKGQELVIQAMARLKSEFADVICLLIGDTAESDAGYRQEIENQLKALGLTGRVLITGFRSDVPNYIASLEVQIHASILPEPFGRVLLEGMALSKPLVASKGGAVPEIVEDGETGLLFEPGNVDALTDGLRKLLMDPERAAALGVAGRRRVVRKFSITCNVQSTQALYARILEGS